LVKWGHYGSVILNRGYTYPGGYAEKNVMADKITTANFDGLLRQYSPRRYLPTEFWPQGTEFFQKLLSVFRTQ
jgi:hypothetical protein